MLNNVYVIANKNNERFIFQDSTLEEYKTESWCLLCSYSSKFIRSTKMKNLTELTLYNKQFLGKLGCITF